MSINLRNKRRIVRTYIKHNPNCTYQDIKRDLKIKVERIYKNMREAYTDANIQLSKNLTKRNKEKQRQEVISFIKSNPGSSIVEIQENTGVNVMRVFGGIQNAYASADVKYPKREVTSGVINPSIMHRCLKFEERIFNLLNIFGNVYPKIRTKDGIVDCLFNYKHKTFAVEVKDFRGKNNITMFEIKQLIRYMEILDLKHGLLICPKESFPKRKNSRNLYIDGKEIKILSEEDLGGRSIKDY